VEADVALTKDKKTELIGSYRTHGTATQDNDKTEAKAIATVFGPAAVPVSSTKRVFGHTLAAAGAIEAVLSVRALQHKVLPGNLGLNHPLDDAKLDLITQPRKSPHLRHVMSNSLGLGGNNAALVLSVAT
jgi:3-oxoacyl-(acyl-carrier-protein) synthase